MPYAPPLHQPRGLIETRKRNEAERQAEKNAFYGRKEWKQLRKLKLALSPLCEQCLANGRIIESKDVDHIQPLKLRPDLALDLKNLRALCHPHHSQKTAHDMWNTKR